MQVAVQPFWQRGILRSAMRLRQLTWEGVCCLVSPKSTYPTCTEISIATSWRSSTGRGELKRRQRALLCVSPRPQATLRDGERWLAWRGSYNGP